MSERQACRLIGCSRSTKRYRVQQATGIDNEGLRERLKQLATERMRFGYRRLHALLVREGWAVNHKRIYRLYREEKLSLRRKRKKRICRWSGESHQAAQAVNERWSMDFVSDSVANKQTVRILNVVDDYTRQSVAVEVDTSLGSARVVRALERAIHEHGRPQAIVCDNGPEFRGRLLEAWSQEWKVRLEFIAPGKPVQNAFVESFNGRMRDECLNGNWFLTVGDARRKIQSWRQDYNERRPHSSLGYRTPVEFAAQSKATQNGETNIRVGS